MCRLFNLQLWIWKEEMVTLDLQILLQDEDLTWIIISDSTHFCFAVTIPDASQANICACNISLVSMESCRVLDWRPAPPTINQLPPTHYPKTQTHTQKWDSGETPYRSANILRTLLPRRNGRYQKVGIRARRQLPLQVTYLQKLKKSLRTPNAFVIHRFVQSWVF